MNEVLVENLGGSFPASSRFTLDAVVVGGGVIGLAIGRALALAGREVMVLEAEPITGSIVSSRNSEVIHAGLYYPTGSLKAKLCVDGKHKLYAYCEERGIAHRRCGKLVVAANEAELAYLEKLRKQAIANNVDDCVLLDGDTVQRMEPNLVAAAALLSPSTGIVDSHGLMAAYVADIESHGGSVVTHSPVLGGRLEGDRVLLSIGGRDPIEIEAALVVNSAGLDAWVVSRNIEGLDTTTIPERHLAKGSYFALTGRAPSQRLIYPVPEPGGLGVHLTLDLAGQARFGPDVEWTETIDYEVDPRRAEKFYAAIRRYWPDLRDDALQPAYSGVRPKVAGPSGGAGDFIIQGPRETGHHGYLALYGIESPGLTSSLAIAEEVRRLALPDRAAELEKS
ncbi:dehydrogenase [Labrys miyagiensis]|uniref:Dehydrogenase n=1 Tax=Labrys miyagiensis TaxID=346912 RepID=A0ABQ6CGJ3_9HYPH|nr:NAD(P)/FAD-dependent oxidoreductase [Labrys miyagiensis]GLS18904.1 dehydrogenase [Labrys miyagiensis]